MPAAVSTCRGGPFAQLAAQSAALCKYEQRSWWSRGASTAEHARLAATGEEQTAQAPLLREVIGPLPFRPMAVGAAWLTPTVANLATAAYEERALPSAELDTARLAVLADALEEAGCADAELLGHLRSPGPHVRGCWVIDLLLGKE